MHSISLKIIGSIKTPYKQKFGIPRQPGLTPEIEGFIELDGLGECSSDYVKGLEQVSHIWVLAYFHKAAYSKVNPALVRPPRLGGRKKVGCLGTRSPFRPNPIALSAMKILGLDDSKSFPVIRVCSPDLLDGTPILDIKPYIAYSDSIPEAHCTWAQQMPEPLFAVRCTEDVWQKIVSLELASVWKQLQQNLAYDHRPLARKNSTHKSYALHFGPWDIRFLVDELKNEVLVIKLD